MSALYAIIFWVTIMGMVSASLFRLAEFALDVWIKRTLRKFA